MNRFFRRLCIHRFGMGPLHIFVFEKRLPAINDAGSSRLRISVIRGVAIWKKNSLASIFRTLSSRVGEYFVHFVSFYLNLAIHWYAESATPRIVDTGSRYLKKKNKFGVDFPNFKQQSRWIFCTCRQFLVEFSHLRSLEKFSAWTN